jgi:hypothetical protein
MSREIILLLRGNYLEKFCFQPCIKRIAIFVQAYNCLAPPVHMTFLRQSGSFNFSGTLEIKKGRCYANTAWLAV